MLIKDLFEKQIDRPIIGVIKADQSDAESVWQELDEYVVTKELDVHLRNFFGAYLDAIDRAGDPDVAGRVGVWVSGFFGSGKSHFIKILSYLLDNKEVAKDGKAKRAIEFFDGKIQDAMLAGDIKRAVGADVDVILFNIDSKADATGGREAILRVFLKVFNEKLGFSGDHPHIAHMERYLHKQGKLEDFRTAFEQESGAKWEDERDAYHFRADDIVDALSATLDQSVDATKRWMDKAEEDFHLNVENFSTWVKEYLDSCGPKHRIIFLVDEMGQFIGQDTHLMLNLQTIAENLGTICGGRAWLVVTSQEDIDAVIGEVRASKANDFSKIQGRFRTRLSLSSANVDEVIQKRLLSKLDTARSELGAIYREKADILKNQLSFANVGMTFKPYADENDFVNVYPFAPYQFQLVQKIFESIRKAGATGLHLARGERSMLDAFQSAVKQIGDEATGLLVPLHRFYPSIEGFLEGVVKSTIDNAAANPSLKPFDGLVLKTLFLIRYVDEIKGNVDNLVTLFVDRIDADRLALREEIEASLQRLEKETLIGRSGEDFFFLTNEERDVGREIKAVELGSGEDTKLLGELIFEDVLRGLRKYRFPDNNKDFGVNRIVDLHPYGTRADGDLVISVITPMGDDYDMYGEGKCIAQSAADHGQVVVKLDNDDVLGRELLTYLRTDKYVRLRHDGSLPQTTVKILRERQEENQQRRERLVTLLERLMAEAELFAAGQAIKTKADKAYGAMEQALNYLVRNSFSKLGYLKHLSENPQAEVRAVLRSSDVADLKLEEEEGNKQALDEVRNVVDLMSGQNRQIVLHDLVEDRFGRRPYGWPDWEVVLLIARLVKAGEISLVMDGATLPVEKVYDAVITPNKWRRITVAKRKTVGREELEKARSLAKTVFSKVGPDGEDALYGFLREHLDAWRSDLNSYKALAETGNYPGKAEIDAALPTIDALLAEKESFPFIEEFLSHNDALVAHSDSVSDIRNFYQTQRPAWDRLRKAFGEFQLNRQELEREPEAASGLKRIEELLESSAPYGQIHQADDLIAKVGVVNEALVAKRREHALQKIDGCIQQIKAELDAAEALPELRNKCLYSLQVIRQQVEDERSIAHIYQAQESARSALDEAFDAVQEAVREAGRPAAEGTGAKGPGLEESAGGGISGKAEAIKKRRVVEATKFVTKTYLEDQADVDEFLEKLRQELDDAIAKNERVEIR